MLGPEHIDRQTHECVGGELDPVESVHQISASAVTWMARFSGSPESPGVNCVPVGTTTVVTAPGVTVKFCVNANPGTDTVPLAAVGALMNSDNSGLST